jgi:hypothetical protein
VLTIAVGIALAATIVPFLNRAASYSGPPIFFDP